MVSDIEPSIESVQQEQIQFEERLRHLHSIAEQAYKDKKLKDTLSDDALVLSILAKFPLLWALLARIKALGVGSYHLAKFHVTDQPIPLPPAINSNAFLLQTFNNLGIIAAAVDLLTLPLLFLACKILKKPSPITLTALGKWIYSGFCLALAITAVAAPISAPIIGVILSILGLIYSVYLLNAFSQDKKALPPKISLVEQQLQGLEDLLTLKKSTMLELQSKLHEINSDSLTRIETLIIRCAQEIEELQQEKIERTKEKIMLTKQLQTYTDAALFDCSMGVGVASALLLSVAIGLFFPPLGFTIATTATCTGAAYALARIAISVAQFLYQQIRSPSIPEEHNSTSKIMHQIGHNNEQEKRQEHSVEQPVELHTEQTTEQCTEPTEELTQSPKKIEEAVPESEEHPAISATLR